MQNNYGRYLPKAGGWFLNMMTLRTYEYVTPYGLGDVVCEVDGDNVELGIYIAPHVGTGYEVCMTHF